MFRRLSRSAALAAALLVLGASGVRAQAVTEEAALADRFYAEAGGYAEWTGGAVDAGGPEALLRARLASRAELRVGLPAYRIADFGGVGEGSLTDPSVGLAVALGTLGGWSVVAIADLAIPLGGEGSLAPLGVVVAGRDVGPVTVGVQVDAAIVPLAVGGAAFASVPVAGPLAVFAEVAGGGGEPVAVALAGASLGVGPAQLDLYLGVGATAAAPDALAGVILSASF